MYLGHHNHGANAFNPNMRQGVIVAFVLIQLLVFGSTTSLSRTGRRGRRPIRRCRYRGTYYDTGQQLTFNVQTKRFDCTCLDDGRLDCTWIHITPPEDAKCADSVSGELKEVGDKWERIRDGKIFDCVCKRGSLGMQISCSDENRCHHDGVSYTRGFMFTTSTINGRRMVCTCLAKKTLECQHEEVLPGPQEDAHWVEDYVIHGGNVQRPHITTLQACRTGAKVVTSGVVWNQTKINAFGVRVLEECTCTDAIVKCKTARIIDKIEPHCVSADGRYREVGQKWLKVREHFPSQQFECFCRGHEDVYCRRVRRPRCIDNIDGTIRVAGEKWIRTHETLPNLRFECTCLSSRKMHCEDIGECDEPSAPVNGALLCANIGKHGPKQVTYCKPMCLPGYEFVNPMRYYRIWEVCGAMNLHRWSGGFVDDPSAIARCTRRIGPTRRGHSNLYLTTNRCDQHDETQIEEQKSLFLRQLHFRSLCGDKCEVTLFKCGRRE
uniref:uncharacterized protein LOC120347174 isoform X1 n=2 Tax=Styela clava TaxID=7725 RepID=UPI00193AA5DA|nr:uncharacterized protein LOC120347174 isoform X1 [Styela clava]